jgi:CIDE-N domain
VCVAGKEKLNVPPGEPVRLLLESDGTQVEDGEYFRTLPNNSVLLLLRPGERWHPAGVDVIRAGIATEPKLGRSLSLSCLLACALARAPHCPRNPIHPPESVAVQPRARLPQFFSDHIFRKCFAKVINGTGRCFSPAPLHPNRASVPCGRARDRTGSLLNFDPFGFVHAKALGFMLNLLGFLSLSLSLFTRFQKLFLYREIFSEELLIFPHVKLNFCPC